MKYLSIQTFQCGISVSGAATFTGGATINVLALNGATTSSEASLFLGAHSASEGGQLVLQKGTSQTYAAHLDNYNDQFRVLYGTNTTSSGSALIVNLATRQLILPAYTSSSSFSGTAAGYLAFDSSGNIITTSVPVSGVSSIIAGTGVTVSSSTGNVTVSIGQSVATSATPSFDQIFLTNNGNGTNVKIGDDAWIGDVNTANTLRIMGQQNNADGYIIFGNSNTTALGRSGTGNLTYGGSTVWTAATLTNLNQLTNGPGYITSAALAGYVPTSRTLTINGTSYDLSADRTWTINTVAYTSRLQHQVKAGVAINKGQAVYVTSADGTNMIVGLASNASEATSSKTMGLLDATVSTNGFANVVTEGLLAGLDTSTAGSEGDPVWLGTGGNLIYGLANKPYAPAHLVFIGIVTRKNNSNGEIFVKVQNGFELNEIHDVDLKTNLPTAGQLLRYNSDGLWKNWSPNYLTAESDTLGTVTSRGSSSAVDIQVNGINVGRGPGALPGYNHNISLGVNNYSPSMTQSRAHIAIGYNSFANLNGGYYSMAIGGYALDAALQPDETIAIGLDALGSATYPGHSVAIGNQSLFADTEGYGNVAVGSRAGSYYNSALGGYGDNTFIGNYAASQLKNSRETTVLGAGALQSTTSNTNQSRGNIALGAGAGYSWNSGYYNTWIGYFTNGFLNGSYNVIIGGNLSTTAIDGAGSMSNSVVIADGAGNIKLFANSSGNVGIGTTSPNEKLHVAGNIHAYAAGGIDAGLFASTSAGSTTIALRSNGVTHFNGGNVGIGTNSPNTKLTILGGDDASGTGVLELATGGGTNLKLGGNSAYSWIQSHSSKPLRINELGNSVIFNLGGGAVGIGTASPATLLDVNGVITATGGNSTQWNTAYSWGNHSSAGYVPQARTLTINGTTYDLSANRSWTIATTTPGGSNTQFQYNSSGTLAGASALTYDSGTNRVGINQASPGYDLDVNGQVRVQDKLRVGTVNSGNGVVHMSSTATINPTSTTIVWSQNVSVGMCAFIEYYILNNNTTTDQRAGTIMVTWNQSGTPTIAHTETTTPDIGSTIAVNFTSSLVGSDARINAVNSSSAPYTIVMSYKYF